MPSPITTTEELSTYLTSRSIPFTSITLLTGGTANFVFRVSLSSSSSTASTSPNAHPKALIYKHAAPFLASNTSFHFPPLRMDYESHLLRKIPSILSTHPLLESSPIKPVTWHAYDAPHKLLTISDGGSRNLKSAYPDPQLDIPRIGTEIGKWIAALHLSTARTSMRLKGDEDEDEEEGGALGNNPVAVAIYRHAYVNLSTALGSHNQDPAFGRRINDEFGSKLATDNICICHGDFWPGNVLVRTAAEGPEAGLGEGEGQGKELPDLTIIDWEMSRRGHPALDIAQFAAEAYLMDRFHNQRGLRVSFLNSYFDSVSSSSATSHGAGAWINVDKQWIKRLAIHWGTHLAFWPTRVAWGSEDEKGGLVALGVKILKMAVEERWEDLEGCELFEGVEGMGRMLEGE